MDDGKGRFVEHDDLEAAKKDMAKKFPDRTSETSGIFQVGEILEIRGSKFLINYMRTDGGMSLKLMLR